MSKPGRTFGQGASLGKPTCHALYASASARRRILLFCLLFPAAHPCFAEWTKTIECPGGRVYRDERKYAGREEFCELLLPGSLVVKDGPYRSWFSEGHPGAEGNYKEGRQIGVWKECDRFDRCKQTAYEPVFAEEKRRPGFKAQIPVSFVNGKYVFDFGSCRSTWITQTNTQDAINLNILGDFPYRCVLGYRPVATRRLEPELRTCEARSEETPHPAPYPSADGPPSPQGGGPFRTFVFSPLPRGEGGPLPALLPAGAGRAFARRRGMELQGAQPATARRRVRG